MNEVDNHRHCQATVLGAIGTPPEEGRTWPTISRLVDELPNLEENWIRYFRHNANVTDDLAGILKLLNWLAGRIAQPTSQPQEAQTPLPGDLINISSDNRTVNVKNNISEDYSGLVGITGSGTNKQLSECPVDVTNADEEGPVIATLKFGDQTFYIRGNSQQPYAQERYVITEDRNDDIVLSGGANDGAFLDHN